MPSAPRTTAPTETKIFTVNQGDANREIEYRQQWGWRLTSTSARSYTSGGTYTGISFGGSIAGQIGQIQADTHHKTDLVMIRVLDGRGRRLKELESEFEERLPISMEKGSTIGASITIFVIGILVITVFGWLIGLAVDEDLGATIAGILDLAFIVVMVFVVRKFRRGDREVKRQNEANEARRQVILAEARRLVA